MHHYQNKWREVNSQHGYVMLIVLVFMQIFSLLGVYGLTSAASTLNASHHAWQSQMNLLAADKILRSVEAKYMQKNADCITSLTSPAWLAKQEKSWWQANACSDNLGEFRYYYVAEVIGKDDCGVIKNNENNQYFTSIYYRITLYVAPDNMKYSTIILQSAIAKSGHEPSSCTHGMHAVHAGRQMRREL